MTRNQINELNMDEAVLQVLNANTSVWSSNVVVSNSIATFTSHVNAINANDTAQKTSTAGTTLSKNNARLDMATAAIALANAGKAYANDTGNVILFDAMNHTQTEIVRAADTDADDICQNIHDNLLPYIGSTGAYGATAVDLTNLQNLINTYSGLIGKPALQKSIVTTATITLVQHFAAANALLKKQLDPLMAQYKITNATFYNQYTAVREINDIGHRHTVTITGFIYDNTNHALAGATVHLAPSNSITKITKATGQYKFTRLHTGAYTIKISATGFVSQTKNLTITENKTEHIDFTLVVDSSSNNSNTQ